MHIIWAVLVGSFVLVSCGKSSTSQMFTVTDTPIPGETTKAVIISKEALNEVFLMSASYIVNDESATSTGLSGKLIYFDADEEKVYLYLSPEGDFVSGGHERGKLVAEFQILSQDDTNIEFDFNAGIKRTFSDNWLSDKSKKLVRPKVNTARIVKSEIVNESILYIEQELDVESYGSNTESVVVRYYIREDIRSADFKVKRMPAQKHFGYFTTQDITEITTGEKYKNALRFPRSKEIKLYYSADWPDEYVPAVKAAARYMDMAIGEMTKVTIQKAPDGIHAPDPRYNIIQWVNDDKAGSAYADILAHPITGEILHAQVYVTSVFATNSKRKARMKLRVLDGVKNVALSKSVSFLPSERLCSRGTNSRQYKEALSGVLAQPNADDKTVEKFTQAYLVEVIAHELGHIFGMRHNFAGSIESNMDSVELSKWVDADIYSDRNLRKTGKYPSTSIMDYNDTNSSLFIGKQLLDGKDLVLPFDKLSLAWGYQDSNEVLKGKYLYCSDEHQSKYLDCNTFDSGSALRASDISSAVSALPVSIIETFIGVKAPYYPGDATDLSIVNIDAASIAKLYSDNLKILKELQKNRSVLELEKGFKKNKVMFKDDFVEYKNLKLKDSLAKLLVPAFTVSIPRMTLKVGSTSRSTYSSDSLYKMTEKLLNSDAYKEFVGLDGKKHQFSDEEKAYILEFSKAFYTKFEKEMFKQVFYNVSTLDLSKFDPKTVEPLADMFASIGPQLILSQDEEGDPYTGQYDGKNTWAKPYRLPGDVRSSVSLVYGAKFPKTDWAKAHKSSLKAKLVAELKSVTGLDKGVSVDKASTKDLKKWIKEQQAVIGKL